MNEKTCRKIIEEESGLNIPENYWAVNQPNLFNIFDKELRLY
jgi:hypothetical protein